MHDAEENMRDLEWSELLALVRVRSDNTGLERSVLASSDKAWIEIARRIRSYVWALNGRFEAHDESIEDDDVVQIVIERLLQPTVIPRALASGNTAGYVLVITRNAVLDKMRAADSRLSRAHRYVESLQVADSSLEPPSDNELSVRLASALAALSEEERYLLHMRFFEDLSLAEIAARLQIMYSAAALRIHRLLNKLHDTLS